MTQAPISLNRRGLMFVLSSPSGAGKTTMSRKLLSQQDNISMSVSVTTRAMRPGEVDGKDYFFIDKAKYDTMVERNELLEHAEVFGNHYGTPKAYAEAHLRNGEDVLFDIDWQGTKQLRATAPNDLVSVFILPPSLPELERRLRARAQDSEEVVQKRMEKAISEISHWTEYDYVIVNQDLDAALVKITSILHAERLKRERQEGLGAFIEALK
ncbi:MAG: guanylate kinase [Alphaproteobacteria bacterium]|nr:guanylate kinase [Alphaproteobacteria bacterium]